MSQGNDFNYSAATDSGTAGSEEVWFVAVASDDIKQMNVDQLDEAFRLGIITEETAVWTEGMAAWQPLGQVLGSDSDEGESAREEPAPALQSSTGYANAAYGNGGFGAVTLQSVQHSYAPGPHSVAPVSVAPVTSSLAPTTHTGHGYGLSGGSSAGFGNGPAPLHVDDDMPAVRQGRRFRPERWALAAAAVVAAGVAVYNNFSSSVASAGTEPAPTSLAARPYDGADPAEKAGVQKGEALEEKQDEAPAGDENSPVVAATKGVAAATAAAAAASIASDDAPSSTKKASDKDSLKGSFSKAFNGKKPAAAKASRAKPRKAASRAPKARAKAKKPGVARSQSAFDPLNDSLP
jgi:hypothetical protein